MGRTDDEPLADRSFRRRRIADSEGQLRAFRLAYDGTEYRGFQRQPDVATVEDALFDALEALGVFDRDGAASAVADSPGTRARAPSTWPTRPPGYAAAGRTDAGVSALAQTIAFACPTWLTPRALNAELPAAIRAWASVDVDPNFHATHDATRREYTYYLHAPRAQGDERVRTALSTLSGRHDFHNLTTEADGTVRTLTATADRDGEFLVIRAAADGFPREFVRRLVTLLRQVATGTADLAFVDRVLDAEPLSGAAGVGPAPPEPLVLSGVSYPDCEFVRDADAAASARQVFRQRRASALVAARVAGLVCDGVERGSIDGDVSVDGEGSGSDSDQ